MKIRKTRSVLVVDDKNLYFRQIPLGYMGNFVYLIGDKKKRECVIIDPAWDVDAVLKEAEKDGMKVVAGVLTHTHFDHCNGVGTLVQKTGVKIYVHENETKYLKEIQPYLVQTKEGSKLKIGDVEMTFLHTPGHSEGGQCVLMSDRIMTGDTLFVGACGRCDLPGGDEKKMMQSLERLASLDGSLRVFAGHAYGDEDSSTIENERHTNPFMKF